MLFYSTIALRHDDVSCSLKQLFVDRHVLDRTPLLLLVFIDTTATAQDFLRGQLIFATAFLRYSFIYAATEGKLFLDLVWISKAALRLRQRDCSELVRQC